MAWYNKFPWTNFHELNLDWIMDIVGKAEKVLPDAAAATEAANEAASLANNNAVAASDAATRANVAARNIDPITATAATVYGEGASVTVEDTNPGKAFHFLIPAGEKGDTGPLAGVGDLIINGNFANPVNQRGASLYDGTGSKKYTIDRWFTTSSVYGAVVVGNRCVTVNEGATINQIIPASFDNSFPSDVDVGYTAVARERNGTLHIANGTDITDSKLSFEIGEANSGITVTLGSGHWEYCALYRGKYTADNIPGYVPENYVTQLAKCQYFFEKKHIDIIVKDSSGMYFTAYYANKRLDSPTIESITTETSGNVTVNPSAWHASNNCAAGVIGAVTNSTAEAHWYGYIYINAEM